MSDDISPLFLGAPATPSQDVRYRQGTIISFDPGTLANTVLVGGTVVSDLPLLGVGEATLLVPGSVVGILAMIGTDGAATWAIIGRFVTPGTAQATEAVALLNSQIQSASVLTQENCTTTVFGDLATPGPEVAITVRGTGRLLVLCTAEIQWTDSSAPIDSGGYATVQMTGANTMSTTTANDTILPAFQVAQTGPTAEHCVATITAQGVFTGLNPGSTLIEMKYANMVTFTSVDFARRTLTVIAL